MNREEVIKKFEKLGMKRQEIVHSNKIFFTNDKFQFKIDIENNLLTILNSSGIVEDKIDLDTYLNK